MMAKKRFIKPKMKFNPGMKKYEVDLDKLQRQPGKKIKIYFCPKCRSKNVGYIFTLKNIFGVLPRQKCRDCGYESAVFPQLVINKKKLEKLNKKVKKRK